jgi:hypothetical protein
MAKHSKDEHESALASDALWGVVSIAKHIKRSIRETRYLISTKAIPVQKLSHRVILGRKSVIDKALSGEDAR